MPANFPKCSYATKEIETCPLWQRPYCKAAYRKLLIPRKPRLAKTACGVRISALRRKNGLVHGRWKTLLRRISKVPWQTLSRVKSLHFVEDSLQQVIADNIYLSIDKTFMEIPLIDISDGCERQFPTARWDGLVVAKLPNGKILIQRKLAIRWAEET